MAYTGKAPWETDTMTDVNAISATKASAPPATPAPKFWQGGNYHYSAAVSPILSEWIFDDRRRANGEMNNLDWLDMKNALNGFTNQYSPMLPKHEAELKKFVANPTEKTWAEIVLPLKAQYKLKK